MGLLFEQETHKIIGACMQVHQKLGCGFLESVYQEALGIEFQKQQIPYIQHQKLQILFDGNPLSKFFVAEYAITPLSSKSKLQYFCILTTQNKLLII